MSATATLVIVGILLAALLVMAFVVRELVRRVKGLAGELRRLREHLDPELRLLEREAAAAEQQVGRLSHRTGPGLREV